MTTPSKADRINPEVAESSASNQDLAAHRGEFVATNDTDGQFSVCDAFEMIVPPLADQCDTVLSVVHEDRDDAVRRTPRAAMRDEYEITDSIQILFNDGYRARAAHCVDGDVNLTVPSHLLKIKLDALRERGQATLISAGASVAEQSQLIATVVDGGATVDAGADLCEFLVFPFARVPATARLRCAITLRDGVCTV